MRPFIVYWNNIPSPYVVERFNALADRDAFDFEAWFNDRTLGHRNWDVDESTWRFKYRYLPISKFFGHILHWPFLLLGRRPDILVSWYAHPSYVLGWMIAYLRGVTTVFRVPEDMGPMGATPSGKGSDKTFHVSASGCY